MKVLGGLLFATGVAIMAYVLGHVDNGRAALSEASSLAATKGVATQSRALKRSGRDEPYIVIDRYSNRLYLRTRHAVLLDAVCSTGSGGRLRDSLDGREWTFETPGGEFTVTSMLTDPWWRKPDWAFIEEGTPIPLDEQQRLDNEMLGEFAIGFGDGYFIHGTIYERLLGTSVTHGCVRVGAEDLRELYRNVRIGTRIYIF